MSTPVFLPAGSEELFGIFTQPSGSPNGVSVLLLAGGGSDPTFGKNQMRRRLALQLADRGFSVLRVNYQGVAESSGSVRDVEFDKPWIDDALGAVRWLESQGHHRIAMIGQCWGARNAVAVADQVDGLAGLALIAPPVSDVTHQEAILSRPLSWYVKKAATLRPQNAAIAWKATGKVRRALRSRVTRFFSGSRPQRAPSGASPRFLQAVQSVLHRGVPVLFLYGSADDFYPEFAQVRAGALGRIADSAGDLLTISVVDARLGGMHEVSTQGLAVDTLASWLDTLVRTDSVASGSRGS
jgi:alpha/beta superfamily hydrolase